jgi:uncharacterized RDD family membrane protein YckC
MLYDLFPLAGLWIVTAAIWTWVGRGYDPRIAPWWMHAGLQLSLLLVAALYFIVSWVRIGQTIGMRAWRIRLVRSGGGQLGTGMAAWRFALALLSLVTVGSGFWYALFDHDRRAWHDRLCGTRVERS